MLIWVCDSSKIFRSLLEVKQLESWTNEEWSFNNDHLTNEQENYLTFYQILKSGMMNCIKA